MDAEEMSECRGLIRLQQTLLEHLVVELEGEAPGQQSRDSFARNNRPGGRIGGRDPWGPFRNSKTNANGLFRCDLCSRTLTYKQKTSVRSVGA